MAERIDGKKLAAEIEAELRTRLAHVSGLPEAGGQAGREAAAHRERPGLATIRVGDDPASIVYLRNKHRACARVGIASRAVERPEATDERALLREIEALNADPEIHGILVQLPLPSQIDPARIARAVAPQKDVDGLHPQNAGDLLADRPALYPCTPLGCLEMLRRHAVPLEGARAAVLGRSNIVGRPMALLLEHQNATVTLCHSRTRQLDEIVRESEIVIAAVGQPHLVRGEWIRPGAAVLDVGIHRVDGRLVGDVEYESASQRAGVISPVPGGVGPLTIAMLLANTVQAFERARAQT